MPAPSPVCDGRGGLWGQCQNLRCFCDITAGCWRGEVGEDYSCSNKGRTSDRIDQAQTIYRLGPLCSLFLIWPAKLEEIIWTVRKQEIARFYHYFFSFQGHYIKELNTVSKHIVLLYVFIFSWRSGMLCLPHIYFFLQWGGPAKPSTHLLLWFLGHIYDPLWTLGQSVLHLVRQCRKYNFNITKVRDCNIQRTWWSVVLNSSWWKWWNSS